MLSNAYFLAKFRFDTAENEPAKNLQNFANFPNFANLAGDGPTLECAELPLRAERPVHAVGLVGADVDHRIREERRDRFEHAAKDASSRSIHA